VKSFPHWLHSLLIICILLTACGQIPQPPSPQPDLTRTPGSELTPIELESGYGVKGPWFELYFTNPASPLSPQGTGGVDGPLVKALDAAKMSIDVAAYSISLNSVRFALVNAHKRGVVVRLVMESTNMDRSDPQALIAAGIPIVGDEQQGLMHDKFIVIDRSEVWLGSMNFTDAGTYDDNNNMIRIYSTKIAENYMTEFEEMFTDHLFGPEIRAETPNPRITIDETPIETYFSPDDGVINSLAGVLNSAEASIHFLAFSFTSNDLGDIVREKDEAGLTVRGVMEEEQVNSNQGTEFDPFKQADVDVRLDGIEGQMHHKVFIIDGKIVAFGSYNFSQSAEERNDENVIIVYNEAIAREFLKEFERVWEQAQRD
jgi:phosphatidylserine/phosphatidylglycerophosphate/cardiolipin synthase-like enzyme